MLLAELNSRWSHVAGGRQYDSYGVGYRERRDVARDKLRIIRALWTEDGAEYRGEYADLEPSWQWPKPVQMPHPPIIVGAGLGPRTLEDILEFGDGWIPLGRFGVTADQVDHVRRTVAERANRRIEISLYENGLDRDRLRTLHEIGCDRIIIRMRASKSNAVMDELDVISVLTRGFLADRRNGQVK